MFQINMRSSVPIYEQLKGRVTEMVAAGILRPDDSLPSVRSLAGDLGINPNTVQKAYAALESEGIIYQIPGRGSFVSGEPDVKEAIVDRHVDSLRQTLIKAKAAGVTRKRADDAVASVYEEDEQ